METKINPKRKFVQKTILFIYAAGWLALSIKLFIDIVNNIPDLKGDKESFSKTLAALSLIFLSFFASLFLFKKVKDLKSKETRKWVTNGILMSLVLLILANLISLVIKK
jgi:hypothetical protein